MGERLFWLSLKRGLEWLEIDIGEARLRKIVKRGKNYLLCRCSNGKYIVFEKKGEWIPIYLDEYEEVIIKWGAIIH